MRRLAVLLFSLLLAGCLDDAPPPRQDGPAPAAATAGGVFAFDCAEGEPAPCARRLGSLAESYAEPFLALDPRDASVLALGVNAMGAPGKPQRAASAVFQDILVSEDGGETWRAATPAAPTPRTPGGLVLTGDPSMVFGLDGALHASGVFAERPAPGDALDPDALFLARGIYHTVSHDRGATWSEPAILARDVGADRNWLTRAPDGRLFLVWFDFVGRTAHARWSADGATWNPLAEMPGCTFPSEVVFPPQGPTLVCAQGAVMRLDPEAGNATEVGTLPELGIPALAATPEGGLVAVSRGGAEGPLVSRSDDGGASWSAPVKVAPLAKDAPKVTRMALGVDAAGGIHIILRLATGSPCEKYPGCPFETLRGPTLVHALLAPDLSLRAETILAEGADDRTRSAALRFQDDMHGAAFAPQVGYLAWAHEGGIDLARLRPTSGEV